MPDQRGGCHRVRTAVIACLIVLGASTASACSESVEHKQSNGQCIEHKTSRLFGLPLLQQEYHCDQG